MSIFRDPQTLLTEGQKLIRKQVLHQITTEPDTFNMYKWEDSYAPCGTTRCLAGWALHFSGRESIRAMVTEQIVDEAIEVMGLTRDEYYEGRYDALDFALFYSDTDDAYRRMGRLAEDA